MAPPLLTHGSTMLWIYRRTPPHASSRSLKEGASRCTILWLSELHPKNPGYRPWLWYKPVQPVQVVPKGSNIPRLLRILCLESWIPEPGPIQLVRVCTGPGSGIQDSKKRLRINLGILDPFGTTCTGCTGLYRGQSPYLRSNTRYVAGFERTKK